MQRASAILVVVMCGLTIIGATTLRPSVLQTSAVQANSVVEFDFDRGLRGDVACWLSGPLLTIPDDSFPASAATRVLSVATAFTANQVMVGHVQSSSVVDVTSTRPMDVTIENVSFGLAKLFASIALGVPAPEVDDKLYGPYTVRISPTSPLTWGEVKDADDLEIVPVLPTVKR